MNWPLIAGVFMDGVAVGVLAQSFADARRHSRAEQRARRALADFQARLTAANDKADAALAEATRETR